MSENKKSKKSVIIIISAVALIAALAVIAVTVVVPYIKYSDDYNAAMALFNNKEYEKAAKAFSKLSYRNSRDMAAKSTEYGNKEKYDAALAYMNDGKYQEAATAFRKIEDYKDSAEMIKQCYVSVFGEEKYMELKSINVGDVYVFGTYEQDGNLSNGKEGIEWQVLAREGDSIMLISKYALAPKAFDSSEDDVKWADCDLRKWLNGEFFNEAFSQEEQKYIPTKHHDQPGNSKYPDIPVGEETEDKVFLLSTKEADTLFADDSARACYATEYAYYLDAFKAPSNGRTWWWTRTAGGGVRLASVVYSYGTISEWGYAMGVDKGCARPVIWIGLE